MWIKICGITSLEDAEAAIAAGADALGFVFAESSRRIALENAYTIVRHAPRTIEKIGVFVDAEFEQVLSAVQAVRLTGIQLHGDKSGELARQIRKRAALVGLSLHLLRVLHFDDAAEFNSTLATERASGRQDTLLVDTRIVGKQGGTGVPFDWPAAGEAFRDHESNFRLVAAGGLDPENVGEAIRTLRPWGVDVSSGVESAPGKKDRQRVVEFVSVARAAALGLVRENLSGSLR